MSTHYSIALAGNPNTGKTTLFNTLTGLRQHTGNWPGKTVLKAEGTYEYGGDTYHLVDLPGTYSLHSQSADEEVARNYVLLEKPTVTLVVVDATAMERNLNLALQVLEMTSSVIICVNLIDEAERKGVSINAKVLEEKLGVPVVLLSARNGIGLPKLLRTIAKMAKGEIQTNPYVVTYSPEMEGKIAILEQEVCQLFGTTYPTRWLALRLLDGDIEFLQTLQTEVIRKEGYKNEHAI